MAERMATLYDCWKAGFRYVHYRMRIYRVKAGTGFPPGKFIVNPWPGWKRKGTGAPCGFLSMEALVEPLVPGDTAWTVLRGVDAERRKGKKLELKMTIQEKPDGRDHEKGTPGAAGAEGPPR